MRLYIIAAAAVALTGCSQTVVEYRDVIVKVPVATPCIPDGARPTAVTPVQETVPREQWDSMSTDQRQAKLLANGVRRVAYEHEAEIVLIACSEIKDK